MTSHSSYGIIFSLKLCLYVEEIIIGTYGITGWKGHEACIHCGMRVAESGKMKRRLWTIESIDLKELVEETEGTGAFV